ncbi:hypothetical protein I307_04020 [Cryptococcus deuterogattii 99/473]|uniref:Uncharacterized protein n=1 Tax=Cryptococcus deuterogattii Ram5 TaxID=1296110 RepID=A0A0D0V229_9TREE|nr:hypothetical protein I309_01764 [Cryptococcus deuterogattii LA55]KIR34144.1 hypothetical protein I352_03379 [Cryptococcus deuterogattii MMRL2647]KIR41471.1 hypothetical protein I313_02600 [Cryptococcus deuterogattii Ram5]KIR71713.1 hypothetical protein I310_04391 [Cryptococcus deuterogattii CA1014]KIR91296.1 hypothetical protein I304_04765 [Cryptococcus deuterogattii CBS 10090]KIR98516.1 hypothetical protein L804_04090 [Cryptococcus deuterogattii 2001/935-1]KIY56557.1 hypothetical protein 
MAASKRPFADPGPSNKEYPPPSQSDFSDSETEVDSDKETVASSFGNAEKEKIAPAPLRYPLRTMEAKKTDDTDSDVSGDDYSTDTTAIESDTKSESWKNRSKVSSRKPICPPSPKLRTKKQRARSYTIHIFSDLQYGRAVAEIAPGAGKAHGHGGVGNG